MNLEVRKIEYEDTKEFIMKKHYAQRMPSIYTLLVYSMGMKWLV